tara:strand:- start:444 stop:689 length:246 start_codon:yes stop_codon:yes gene_type:complete
MRHIEIRTMLARHYNRNLSDYDLEDIEMDYQNAISKLSQAYLEGSWWYVGKSYIEYFRNRKFDRKFFGPAAGYAIFKIFNE